MICGGTFASDLAIGSTITSPISGCDLTNSELVKVTVINAATTAYSGTFDVSYQLNNNATVTESVTVVILPVGGTYIYEFSALLDLSPCGIQSLTLSVFDVNDVDFSNDTVMTNITNDCSPIPGVFTGPGSVCELGNSGQITVNGNTGIITDWAYSEDLGTTLMYLNNSGSSQSYSNISSERLYRIYYDSQHGLCPSDSVDYQILVDMASDAGVLSSDSIHCDTILPTTLYLNGYNGTINHYKLSLNGGTAYTTFTNPYDTLQYTELSNSFQFFAITQNGSCPPDSSNIVSIGFADLPNAGEIIGEDTLCAGMTTTDLELINFDGAIVDWDYSLNNGNTWNSTGLTTSSVSISGITGNSIIRVIVEKLPCGIDTSFFNIFVSSGSETGLLTGSIAHCGPVNSGEIITTGFNGEILEWIQSPAGQGNFTSINSQNDTIDYVNNVVSTDYAVVVQFGTCQPDTSDIVTVTISTLSNAGEILAPDTICSSPDGIDIELINNLGSVLDWEFSIDGGETWISAGITDSSYTYTNTFENPEFRVIVKNEACPADTSFSTVVLFSSPPPFSLLDTIFLGDSIQLNATMGESFVWSPAVNISSIFIRNPKVAPNISLTYAVAVTDSNGCITNSTHEIIVIDNPNTIAINNFASPNGDGYNDIWLIKNIELFPNNSVVVFNAYGQIIFEASPYNNNWDISADNIPDGTYFYTVITKPNTPPAKGALTIVNSK